MAKIHKITVYVIDPNEMYDGWDEILDYSCQDVFWETASKEERSFEWEDDLPINNSSCPIEEYEKYFSK